MRQIMPHRNNIHMRRIKCKIFLRSRIEMAGSATFLPHSGGARFIGCGNFLIGNNGLHVS
jgi:hypothetical protein